MEYAPLVMVTGLVLPPHVASSVAVGPLVASAIVPATVQLTVFVPPVGAAPDIETGPIVGAVLSIFTGVVTAVLMPTRLVAVTVCEHSVQHEQ